MLKLLPLIIICVILPFGCELPTNNGQKAISNNAKTTLKINPDDSLLVIDEDLKFDDLDELDAEATNSLDLITDMDREIQKDLDDDDDNDNSAHKTKSKTPKDDPLDDLDSLDPDEPPTKPLAKSKLAKP